jgi:ligand-binding sensor domain-containing protein/signal transduction histidine kinase
MEKSIMLAAVFCGLLGGHVPASAAGNGLDPTRDLTQYSLTSWSKREGLPQNSVCAIAQTPDGYLWFGTMEGLARFDGVTFRVHNVRNTPQLGINYVSALLVTRDSTLWIGTTGAGLLRMRGGSFHRGTATPDLDRAIVWQIVQDRAGRIWAATNIGLVLIESDSVKRIFSQADGLPLTSVNSLCEDSSRTILALTRKGIWKLDGDCFFPYLLSTDPKADKNKIPGAMSSSRGVGGPLIAGIPATLIAGRDSSLWIGTWNAGLYRFRGGFLQNYSQKEGLSPGAVTKLHEDSRGSLWVGTSYGGVSRLVNGKSSGLTSSNGLSGDEILSLFEDREGNFWIGVSTGGVNRLVNSKFITYRTGQTPFDNMVWGIHADRQGRVFAGTGSGALMEFQGGKFLPSPLMKAKVTGVMFSMVEDRRGRRWIGTTDGIHCLDRGKPRTFPVGRVFTVAEDRFGRIWAAGLKGLLFFNGLEFQPAFSDSALMWVSVRQVAFDRSGHVWLATNDRGVGRMPLPPQGGLPFGPGPNAITWFQHEQGLSSNWITHVIADSADRVWVATYGGALNLIRGDSVRSFNATSGLPEDGLMSMIGDGLGTFWLTSNNGVMRVSKADLLAYADGTAMVVPVQTFGVSDGMYSDECNGGYQASATRTPDGKLWFPTTAGVVMVDPRSLPVNTIPPTVVLDRVRVDNIDGETRGGAEYAPGNGELEFQFSGLSFSAPERVRYRYMLEGFNQSWIDAASRREAYYTNIDPGKYRFKVIACNADGVWSDAGVIYAFTLRPHFRQTIWFSLLVGMSLLLAAAGVMMLYKRDRDRELQGSQLESKLTQAQLQILEMQLQPHFLFNTLNGIMVLIREDPETASLMIARLSEFLRLTLESAGAQEVTLRRELEFLDRYVQIERLRFGDRLTVEQEVPHELLDAMVPNLILQPLVENAIRHGVSKRRGQALISIGVTRENGTLSIHVRDNGTGLPARDSADVKEGIGLSNTRARLRHLYGQKQRFELNSPPGGGVSVLLSLPFHT